MTMNGTRTAYKQKRGVRRSPRHAFLFQISGQKPTKVWATVKPAKSDVEIVLREQDVQKAIELDGFGDAQNCAGAVCAKRHRSSFDHTVTGHFDWLYRRLYVSDSNTKIGLPKTCVAYAHNDPVANLFDSADGLKRLLKLIRTNGPITIKLTPIVYRQREIGRPKGKPDAPQQRKMGAVGHKLRMTQFKAGWLKQAIEAA